ncbi:hypothetical protein BaRGS_00029620, partial [Batillaria attramentaria]
TSAGEDEYASLETGEYLLHDDASADSGDLQYISAATPSLSASSPAMFSGTAPQLRNCTQISDNQTGVMG